MSAFARQVLVAGANLQIHICKRTLGDSTAPEGQAGARVSKGGSRNMELRSIRHQRLSAVDMRLVELRKHQPEQT